MHTYNDILIYWSNQKSHMNIMTLPLLLLNTPTSMRKSKKNQKEIPVGTKQYLAEVKCAI